MLASEKTNKQANKQTKKQFTTWKDVKWGLPESTDDSGEHVLHKVSVDLFFMSRIVLVDLNNLTPRHLPALNFQGKGSSDKHAILML